MEEKIQFISTVKDFLSVKKMNITEDVENRDIVEFLSAIQVSTNNKISELLEKIIDVNKLKEELKDMFELDLNKFYKELNSTKTKKAITSKLDASLNKQLKDALIEAYKVYLFEEYTKSNKMITAYHQIIFPTRKKQLKKAIKK